MILDILTKRAINSPSVPLSADRIIDYLGGGRTSTAGVKVTRETVLGLPAVKRAVELISQSVAKLPLVVYRRTEDDGKERARNHPAYRLLWKKPNPTTTSYKFIETLTANALLQGNGYGLIQRSGTTPIGIWWVDPDQMVPTRVHMANGTSEIVYVLRSSGGDRKYNQRDVLHIKGLGYDGLIGYSAIDIMRESFGLSIGAQRYGSVFFRNNARPNMVIEMPGRLVDETAIDRFRKSWGDIHQGVENSHRPAILEEGAKVSSFAVNNEDAQFLQTREFEVVQLANIFGVPPHKLGAKIATSHNSLEQENRNFLNDGLGGWLCNWKHESEDKLLSEGEKENDTHLIEQIRDELERADRKTEAEADAIDLNNGTKNLNEIRRKRNLSTVEEGDRHRIPLNMGFIDDEQPAEQPPEDTPAPAPLQVMPADDEAASASRETIRQLVGGIVAGNLRRVSRQASVAAGKGEDKFRDYVATLVDKNCSTFADSLTGVDNSSEAARACLESVVSDMRQIMEQVPASQWQSSVKQTMELHLSDGPNSVNQFLNLTT
jgi:HK97 family phage portal protein